MAEKKKSNSKNTKKDLTKEEKTKVATPKKKTTSTKKTPKTSSKKGSPSETKKVSEKVVKKTSSSKESTPKKKTPATKTPTKKEPVAKTIKEEVKKDEPKENLEKTIIFDGNQSKNIRDVVNKLEEDNVVLDDKVIKRSKGKKIVIILLVILIYAFIFGTIGYVIGTNIREAENSLTVESNIYKKVSRNYKSIKDIENNQTDSETKTVTDETEYTNIETISLTDFEKKAYNKENMVVLVASSTCYHCITYEPIINEVFKSLDRKIYRINITALTDDEVTRFRTYYAFQVTPTIFTIKDGIVTAESTGTMTNEELTNWLNDNANF